MELVVEKYKQTDIGLIPSDWEVKALGEIGECIIGLTYKPENVKEDGILVLRSSNIKNNSLKFDDNVFVDVEVSENLIVKEGDILICVRNGSRNLIGKCAMIDKRVEGETFGAFMSVFRTQFFSFVFHQFNSYIIQKQIEENIGATINQITNKNLNSFLIPFPKSTEEQTAIATALSDAEALIASLEKLIAKKQNIKQGAMQNLLTPQKNWVVKKLWEVCDVRDGTHESPKYFKNGIPFVTSKNIIRGRIDYTDISFISYDDAKNIDNRSKVNRGDILMSMIGTIGNCVLIDFEPDFCIKNVALIKPEKVEGTFLIQLLYSDFYQTYIQSKLDGGIQKFISLGVLRELDVSIPPTKDEQQTISQILTDMDADIAALEAKLNKYKMLKQGMMQNLLTGKIRLV